MSGGRPSAFAHDIRDPACLPVTDQDRAPTRLLIVLDPLAAIVIGAH
ncbi:hypothetical protein [Streptomyces sp. NPDC060010]